MDDRRARLEELRKRKRYAELKAKQGNQGSVPRETSGEEKSFLQGVKDFGRSFTEGSDIGENMPGGRFLAETGTKIGAGIAAGMKAPFSDKPYGQLYEESLAPSTAIRERERAADEASPVGSFVKSTLAGVPIGAMKAAGAGRAAAPIAEEAIETSVPLGTQASQQATKQAAKAAEPAAMRTVQKMDPFTKKMTTVTEPIAPPSVTPQRTAIDPFTKKPIPNQGAPAPQPQTAMREVTEQIAPEPFAQGTGQFSYPKDTMKEKLMEYFQRQNMPTGEPGMLKKAAPFLKEQAEELLPYPARAALRGYRRYKKGGMD